MSRANFSFKPLKQPHRMDFSIPDRDTGTKCKERATTWREKVPGKHRSTDDLVLWCWRRAALLSFDFGLCQINHYQSQRRGAATTREHRQERCSRNVLRKRKSILVKDEMFKRQASKYLLLRWVHPSTCKILSRALRCISSCLFVAGQLCFSSEVRNWNSSSQICFDHGLLSRMFFSALTHIEISVLRY